MSANNRAPLRILGSFTDTEVKIASLLLEGHDRIDLARLSGRSEHTIKQHLGKMYNKAGIVTGCKQVKLAMLLSGRQVEA